MSFERYVVDPEHPYLGLTPFGEKDSPYFFGRDEEGAELFRLIRRRDATVLFGASGLGKTSVLKAGLFPRLREAKLFPIYIRLDFGKNVANMTDIVWWTVAKQTDKHSVDAPKPSDEETLWEYFQRAEFWDQSNRLLTPVLVFDQFEEVFTLGSGDPRAHNFLVQLGDLVENRIPVEARQRILSPENDLSYDLENQHYKVLLSFREDYVAHLEDLVELIPSLRRNRYRLTALNGHQGLKAIQEPGRLKQDGEIVSDAVALEILKVAAGVETDNDTELTESLDRLEVEPSLLSLFCRQLNLRRIKKGLTHVNAELLAESQGQIVEDFYEQSLEDKPKELRGFIESSLLTTAGYRRAEAIEEALTVEGITQEDIDDLVNRRLLRRESRLGRPHVELIHDRLTDVVRASRRDRELRDEKDASIRRVKKIGASGVALLILLFVVLAWFERNQQEETEMQIAAVQRELYLDSMAIRIDMLNDSVRVLQTAAENRAFQQQSLVDTLATLAVANSSVNSDSVAKLLSASAKVDDSQKSGQPIVVLAGLKVRHGDVIDSITPIYREITADDYLNSRKYDGPKVGGDGGGDVQIIEKEGHVVTGLILERGNYYGGIEAVRLQLTWSRISSRGIVPNSQSTSAMIGSPQVATFEAPRVIETRPGYYVSELRASTSARGYVQDIFVRQDVLPAILDYISAMNSDDRTERRHATHILKNEYAGRSDVTGLVLDALSGTLLDQPVTDAGRANYLFFLTNTNPGAWTPALKLRGQEMVAKSRELKFGPKTTGSINKVSEMLESLSL